MNERKEEIHKEITNKGKKEENGKIINGYQKSKMKYERKKESHVYPNRWGYNSMGIRVLAQRAAPPPPARFQYSLLQACYHGLLQSPSPQSGDSALWLHIQEHPGATQC
jgi:hypothetical protein